MVDRGCRRELEEIANLVWIQPPILAQWTTGYSLRPCWLSAALAKKYFLFGPQLAVTLMPSCDITRLHISLPHMISYYSQRSTQHCQTLKRKRSQDNDGCFGIRTVVFIMQTSSLRCCITSLQHFLLLLPPPLENKM